MANVFISYAHEDEAIAQQLSEMLKAEHQKVFFDQGIAAGADFSEIVEKALTDAKAIVVLLSRNSNRSRWVDAELRSALQSGKVVIPVLLDEEATSNWVWPLISDRNWIKIDSPEQIREVVYRINQAIGYVDKPEFRPLLSASPRTERSRWVILWVALLSALAGALFMFMWLTR